MKTLSPAVITLPWRQDAAERYFSTLSHLPWAMLHFGQADHPHNRFDILVADPVTTLGYTSYRDRSAGRARNLALA
jgi:para-aminobenzoate synthetase component 1